MVSIQASPHRVGSRPTPGCRHTSIRLRVNEHLVESWKHVRVKFPLTIHSLYPYTHQKVTSRRAPISRVRAVRSGVHQS